MANAFNFDKDDYKASLLCEFQKFADYFNASLYDAFKTPDKLLTDRPYRTAMILLIDKAYSAGLSRQSKLTNGESPFALWEISEKLNDRVNLSRLTEIVNTAAEMDGSLNSKNCKLAIDVVEKFKVLLSEVNGTGKTPRAFAPKFLHFVSRAIPPWDNYASKALAVATRKPKNHMQDYETYVENFFHFCNTFTRRKNFAVAR